MVRREAPARVERRAARARAAYRTGTWAWWLHRVSGLLILAYLYFHLIVLSSAIWRGGEAAFNRVVAVLTSPPFLAADLVLFALILYHALNGIRIMLLDLGMWVDRQETVFWVLMALGAALLVAAAAALLPTA
ncbi:Succinate dehydrogenase, cytochrome b556 subunit [Candidatus Hydrogenisulfobacillus filiaventi]|uniref:Succinate dehydrogenase, cytochrome b556 subunit n=1 Tax=Candidatus Hydrogenisulfobacillus filiaventi TaxID=2707344 RepID=A0A6F8ZGF2_9FIRM|nr:succinate dehydrogenase, cytochrome b556 subunit [Bacillota bacterium]CAB1128965.1 Succinate dehydrogenase, cytochrome b556 subunit [Candidatus Hydrogenisulfobacillus filiaventi]